MKKVILILGILIIGLFLLGCVNKPPIPTECKDLDWEKKDTCVTKIAIEDGNPDLCLNVTYSNYCMHSVINTTENWSDCAKITADTVASQCYFSAAVKTQDPSFCSNITIAYNGIPNLEETQAKQKECQDNYQKFTSYGINTCGRGVNKFTCCNDPSTKKYNPGCK